MAAGESFYRAAERRIELLTLALGVAASCVGAIGWGWRAAAGLALGAGLAWVNYRWLKQGIDTMARLAASGVDAARGRVSKWVYAKFFGRFVVLIAVLYVILARSLLPGAALLVGLFVLVAAVLIELIYELLRGIRQTNEN